MLQTLLTFKLVQIIEKISLMKIQLLHKIGMVYHHFHQDLTILIEYFDEIINTYFSILNYAKT